MELAFVIRDLSAQKIAGLPRRETVSMPEAVAALALPKINSFLTSDAKNYHSKNSLTSDHRFAHFSSRSLPFSSSFFRSSSLSKSI